MKYTVESIARNLAQGPNKLTDEGLKSYTEDQARKIATEIKYGRKPASYLIYYKAGQMAMRLRKLIWKHY